MKLLDTVALLEDMPAIRLWRGIGRKFSMMGFLLVNQQKKCSIKQRQLIGRQ